MIPAAYQPGTLAQDARDSFNWPRSPCASSSHLRRRPRTLAAPARPVPPCRAAAPPLFRHTTAPRSPQAVAKASPESKTIPGANPSRSRPRSRPNRPGAELQVSGRRSDFLAATSAPAALNPATPLQRPRGPSRRSCRLGGALQRFIFELCPAVSARSRR